MKVVFFDGGCVLCSGMVRWTHRRDRREEIWFAALESEFATEYREELNLPAAGAGAETFVFWNQEQSEESVTFKSEGALTLLQELGGFWTFIGTVGKLAPRGLRDLVYDWIARNRRKWFGSSEECQLPPESLRGKVLA